MAKVLVVDDETPIALLLENYLVSAGHSVTSARSALGSMCWLDQDLFDIVILDVMMPGPLSGLDVCRILKSDPRTLATRVAVVSGMPDMEANALEAGADAFLAKPFLLEEMGEFIEILARSNPHGRPAARFRSAIGPCARSSRTTTHWRLRRALLSRAPPEGSSNSS